MLRVCVITVLLLACGQTRFDGSALPEINQGSGDSEGDLAVTTETLALSYEEAFFTANPTEDGEQGGEVGSNPQRYASIEIKAERKPSKALNNRSSKGKLDILMVIDNSQDNGSRNIKYNKIAKVIETFLKQIGAVDWQLTLASGEKYANSRQLAKIKKSSSISTIVNKIKNFTSDVQTSWKVYDERVVWKTRNTLGDVDQSNSNAWKGRSNLPAEQRTQNFFPYSKWNGNKWVKDGYNSSHSWLRHDATLAVILISDEDHQCMRAHSCSINPKPSPCSFYGLGFDTGVIDGQGNKPSNYEWNSFDCGIENHLIAELNYHKGEDKWRLFGIFDIKRTCSELGDNYNTNSVWIKNSNKKHVNPCFKERFGQSTPASSFAFAYSYKTRYKERFSAIFDLNAGNYSQFPAKVKKDIGEHLIEAQYNLGFTCNEDDLEVKVGNQVVSKSEYTLQGQILTFNNKRIFF